MSEFDNDDLRVVYIKYNALNMLHLNAATWDEMIWKEENQSVVKEFLDAPSANLLLFYFDHNNKLTSSLAVPDFSTMPKIIVYFIKDNIAISSENCKREIMCGNLFNCPLIQFQKLFEILYPLFSNPSTNKRWPEEIANDVVMHFQDFHKTLTYHIGVAENRSVLVFSELAKKIENIQLDEISSDSTDCEIHSVINAITDMLCDWIPIIKEVIDFTSEDILKKIHQGPITEIQFWNDRKDNLEFIQKQVVYSLNEPCIEKMVFALERCGSNHFHLFKKLLQDVSEALVEASEISNSLSDMSDQLLKLEKTDFPELTEEIPLAVKVVTLSWSNSKYFNRVPSRIAVLLQKICYFLMDKIQKFLNPPELFKSKRSQMKENVKVTIKACNVFLESYSDYQENKTYPWQFPDKRVFDFLEGFLDRLNKIYELFEASEVYSSIPEYKMLGILQAPFKIRLNELSTSFEQLYKVFVESSHNPLDLTSKAFLEVYSVFCIKVTELDYTLGTVLAQACMVCVTPVDSFKIMNLIHGLLQRPVAEKEFKKVVTPFLKNIYDDLSLAKEKFNNLNLQLDSGKPITFRNISFTAGVMQWCLDLKKNIASPINSLGKIKNYFVNIDDADLILKTFTETDENLSNLQIETMNNWKSDLDSVKEHLNEPIFKMNGESQLVLNFSHKIFDLSQEVKCLKRLKKENLLPQEAVDIDELLNRILQAYPLLACSSRWYSDLNDNLMKFEKALVKDEWDKVCNNFTTGLDTRWTNNDLQKYSEDIYLMTKSLFERINQAKENVQSIEMVIRTWNKSPVFVRNKPDSLVNFEMFITPKMRQQIYKVIETSLNMTRVMEENMLLFQCNSESDEWKNYVIYLESVIENGLKESIKCSLAYLVENTSKDNKKLTPFYKINMILMEDIRFVPSLDKRDQGNVYKLLKAVIENIYHPAAEIKRMTDSEKNYYESITEDNKINNLKEKIISNFQNGISRILAKLATYKTFADLWLENIETVLDDFVLYGPAPDTKTNEKRDTADIEVSLELKPPSEDEFRTEISHFDMLYKKVEDMTSELQVESWLLLDVSSFKETLLSLIRNWSTAYKKKLVELKSQGKLRKLEDDSDL